MIDLDLHPEPRAQSRSMAKSNLPATWRRGAYQIDPPDVADANIFSLSPNLETAVDRGWEIVFHVAVGTRDIGTGLKGIFAVEIYARGIMLQSLAYPTIGEAIRFAELFASMLPNAYVYVAGQEQQAIEFGLTGADDLLDHEPAVREWHVEGMLPAGLPTMIYGDGGTGKSLAALQLAVAGVSGRLWFGHHVRPGPCIYMSAEDDEDEIHRRLSDISRREGLSRSDLAGLRINAKVGEDALLGVLSSDTRTIEPTDLFFALDRTVQKTAPALLILDTLADVFGGDENVRGQARQFVGLMRRLIRHHGTTVLCAAHPSVAGMNSGTGTSGSTGWSNSVRSRLYLERVLEWRGKGDARKLTEADPDVRILTTKKINYGRTGGEIRMRWVNGVFEREDANAALLVAEPIPAAEHSAAALDDLFVSLLAAYTEEGVNVGPSPSSSYAPSLFAKDERSGKATKIALTKAMRRLIASKKVAIEDYGPPSRRTKRLTLQTHDATSEPSDLPAD